MESQGSEEEGWRVRVREGEVRMEVRSKRHTSCWRKGPHTRSGVETVSPRASEGTGPADPWMLALFSSGSYSVQITDLRN